MKLICDKKGRCKAHADGMPVADRCPGWCDCCGQWPYATEVEEDDGSELSLCHGCAAEWHAGKAGTNVARAPNNLALVEMVYDLHVRCCLKPVIARSVWELMEKSLRAAGFR